MDLSCLIQNKWNGMEFIRGARIMKTSHWRQAVENRCVFSARLKALSDTSGDRSAGGRRFHVDGPLTAKLRCPVAIRLPNYPSP